MTYFFCFFVFVWVFYEIRKFKGNTIIKETTKPNYKYTKDRVTNDDHKKIRLGWVDHKDLSTMSAMAMVICRKNSVLAKTRDISSGLVLTSISMIGESIGGGDVGQIMVHSEN